jgi:putative photosynthetic complex assembly protein 2
MLEIAIPALFAVFVWWFSTGLILLLDNLPRTTFRWSLLISSLIGAAALVGLVGSAPVDTVGGAYCGFACALLVWGWHELSFLTGWITGPRRRASPPGASHWLRFVHAVQAILWHELAIIVIGLAIVALTWGEPNQVGTWTFLVLWIMRTSAKLNLYLGVRNLSEEFLPPHLKYMASFFRKRPMNLLFPVSVTASTAVAVLMVQAALAPWASDAETVGLTLAATMLGLAILEHWLLVLPIPATALWRWAMRQPGPEDPTSAQEPLAHAR